MSRKMSKAWIKKHPAQYIAQWNRQAGEFPTTPIAKIDATICKPKHIMYLDTISAINENGEVACTIKYDDNAVPEKRKRKPKMTHCPHCGKSLREPKTKWNFKRRKTK